MVQHIKRFFGNTVAVIKQYPLVLLCALLLSLGLIYDDSEGLKPHLLSFALGISLLFALNQLERKIPRFKWWARLIGVLLLFLFYWYLPKTENDWYPQPFYVIALVFLMSHLLVAFLPYLSEKEEVSFWNYNKSTFLYFIQTFIFTAVLIVGIEGAILAVETLFGLDLDGDIYFKVYLFLHSFGSVLIFLVFNHKGIHFLEREKKYPIVLKFFTQYVLIPLILIYGIILYAYGAKILFTWELPKGIITYLVTAFTVLGTLAILLVHPLAKLDGKSWVKKFHQLFYFSLYPLLILIAVAIYRRVSDYGITENRYLVICIALWIAFMSFYFTWSKRKRIKAIPIAIFCLLFVALFVPKLNMFHVAKESQWNQLVKKLKENDLLDSEGKFISNKIIDQEAFDDLDSKMAFFDERKDTSRIFSLFGEEKPIDSLGFSSKEFHSMFKLVDAGNSVVRSYSTEIKSKEAFVRVNNKKVYPLGDSYSEESYFLVDNELRHNGVAFSLETFTQNLHEKYGKKENITLPIEELTVPNFVLDGKKTSLVFTRLSLKVSGELNDWNIEGFVLVEE